MAIFNRFAVSDKKKINNMSMRCLVFQQLVCFGTWIKMCIIKARGFIFFFFHFGYFTVFAMDEQNRLFVALTKSEIRSVDGWKKFEQVTHMIFWLIFGRFVCFFFFWLVNIPPKLIETMKLIKNGTLLYVHLSGQKKT